MRTASSHLDLMIWQKAMSLATGVYIAARPMPRDDRLVLGYHLQAYGSVTAFENRRRPGA
jgi:hypothetical protein